MTETDALTNDVPLTGGVNEQPPNVSLLEGQPAAVIGAIVAAVDAILVAAVPLPAWLEPILVAVVTIAGAFGIYTRVTPVAKPRDNAGQPLTP